ncbi:MAG: glycosyltransferase family 9 protein [Candidatus Omnitrophota bacterium]
MIKKIKIKVPDRYKHNAIFFVLKALRGWFYRLPSRLTLMCAIFQVRLLLIRYKKLLFFVPDFFATGDTLALSPVVRAFKKSNNSAVVYIGRRDSVALTRRIEGFDYSFVCHPLELFNELEKKCNLKTVIRLRLGTDFNKFRKDLIETEWEQIGSGVIEDKTIRYRLTRNEEHFAAQYQKRYGDYLIFAPESSSYSDKKRWLDDYWQKLIDLQTAPVIIVGISPEPTFRHCIDLRGKTTKNEMAALIKYCRLFIGLSSGPLWFARAFGKEALVVIGGYELPENSKYDKSYHFFTNLACSLCGLRPQERCVYDMECMRKITPEMVNNEIKQRLFEGSSKI